MKTHQCPQINAWWKISASYTLLNDNSSLFSGREFHQVGVRAEKVLTVVKGSWISLGPGTTNRFFYPEHKVLLRVYQVRQSL